MPTNELTASFQLSGSAGLTATDRAIYSPSGAVQIGAGGFDALLAEFTDGTGAGEANELYVAQHTIATVTDLDLDLVGGGLKNTLGDTLALTSIKAILISIDDADGSKKVRFGPQGVTNAWQGPFGGVTSSHYVEIPYWQPFINPNAAGWAVGTGATDVLRLHNPGGASITVNVVIVGNK